MMAIPHLWNQCSLRPEGFVEALQFMLDDIFAPKPKSLKQRGGIGNEHYLV